MPDQFSVDASTQARVVAEAVRRGRRLRARRRALAAALAATVVVLGAVTATLSADSGGRHSSRTIVVTPADPPAPSTTTALIGATSVATSTTTTTIVTTTTTTRTAPATTTASIHLATPRTTLTTSAAQPTTTTTATTAIPNCAESQFTFTVSVPSPSYPQGQPIPLTGTLRNAGATCRDANGYTSGCWTGDLVASNDMGQVVWQDYARPMNYEAVSNCPNTDPTAILSAGWSESYTRTWNQTNCVYDPNGQRGQANASCPNMQVPAGTYSLSISNHPFGHLNSTSATLVQITPP